METWSGSEAVCLLLGFDPRVALQKALRESQSKTQLLREYRELAILVERAGSKLADRSNFQPLDLLEWAVFHDLEVPQALQSAVEKYKGPIQEWDPDRGRFAKMSITVRPANTEASRANIKFGQSDNAQPNPKTKTSLLKLIAGMAIQGYRFRPDASRNEAISEIERDLRELGIPLSDDTIRKWVETACDEIDWEAVDPEIREKLSGR